MAIMENFGGHISLPEMPSTFDLISYLLDRNMDHVVLQIYTHLDFASLRRTLWVNQEWRRFTINNMARIKFDDLEIRYNAANASNKSLIFDTCILPESWWEPKGSPTLFNKLRMHILGQDIQSLEDIWPLRVPPTPPNVERRTFLFNRKYFLYLNDHRCSLRQSRDTGEVDVIEPNDIMLKCDEDTKTCKNYVVIYDDKHENKIKTHFCKLDDEAENITPVFEMALECPDYFITTEVLGKSYVDGTEYFLHGCYRRDYGTDLRLIDVTTGAEIWQKFYSSQDYWEVDKFIFGDGFVVVAKLPVGKENQEEIEIIQMQSGETLANHVLDTCSDYIDLYMRVQNRIIIIASKSEHKSEDFRCFLLDVTDPSKEPKQVRQPVPKEYKSLNEVVLYGNSHIVACLASNRSDAIFFQSKLIFIMFDINAKVEVRRVILDDLACIGCVREVFLLRQVGGKAKVKEETKFLLCGFNRSLKMLKTLTELH